MIKYLTKEQVILLNVVLLKKYSSKEDVGIKSPDLLDSAINRPRQSAFGEDAYKTIFAKAAALFQSIVQNHPFFNGNKRTAYAALEAFLRKNGYVIRATDMDKIDLTIEVSDQQNKRSVKDIAKWIEKKSKPIPL